MLKYDCIAFTLQLCSHLLVFQTLALKLRTRFYHDPDYEESHLAYTHRFLWLIPRMLTGKSSARLSLRKLTLTEACFNTNGIPLMMSTTGHLGADIQLLIEAIVSWPTDLRAMSVKWKSIKSLRRVRGPDAYADTRHLFFRRLLPPGPSSTHTTRRCIWRILTENR